MEQTREVSNGRRGNRGRGRGGWRGGWRSGGKGGGGGIGGRAGGGFGELEHGGSLGDGKEAAEGTKDGWSSGRGSMREGGRETRGRRRRGGKRGRARENGRTSDSRSETLRRLKEKRSENGLEGLLGYENIRDLKNKSPEEIVLHLTSEGCLWSTEHLVKKQSIITDDFLVLTMNIFAKGCDSSGKDDLFKLLSLLPGSSLLNVHLRRNLNTLSPNSMLPAEVVPYLKNVVRIMNELLQKFPNSYFDLPLSDLYCAIRSASHSGQLPDDTLVKEIHAMMKLPMENAEELKRKEEEKRQIRMKPPENAKTNDDVDPPENFRCLSVIPTQEDISTGGAPFLRRNKVDGAYEDVEHYLDVQFRLLREDFQRPLREGITKLLKCPGSTKIGALQDIFVYNNVSLLYPICTFNGIHYKIKFDNFKLKHVRWENSKRLIFGSLLCLSSDQFDTIVFATVANRELPEIRRGMLDIQFITPSDIEGLEESDVYQMVESTAYFEAYRHVLKGLQWISPDYLPFKEYIVNCQEQVEPPVYLRSMLQGQVTFDLTPIVKNVRKATFKSVPILNLDSWPSAENLGLDDSQYRALQMALTKEFAIIQGPPGTGKTFIGLKIAKVLLHNKRKWDSDKARSWHWSLQSLNHRPVLVVCYTNHALDQFLEGIHQFHPKGIVRIGGRSQSETLKPCSLSELKQKMRKEKKVPQHIRKRLHEAHTTMEDTESILKWAADGLKKCRKNILSEDVLQYRAESMTEAHYLSLKEKTLISDGHEHNAMLRWLNLSLNSVNFSQGDVCEMDGGVDADVETKEEEKEERENHENQDVLYEAKVMETQRVLDDEEVTVYNSEPTRRNEDLTVVNPFTCIGEGENEWQAQDAHRLKRKLKRTINLELNKKDVMPDEEAKMITDVWSLSQEDRWRLYRRWVQDVREFYHQDISNLHHDFEKGVENLKQIKSQVDLFILREADVIGMTTTGAAKYSKILAELQPRITIVEEAAEVLESHIVTSLTSGCHHLILIGDHQQLRPNPTVYELAKNYNLDVSLFERMVKNRVPYERLRLQHRMRPEISKMLEHIYFNPKLENHKSVLTFENIKGVTTNVFFVDHVESEDFLMEGRSRSNQHEAKFIAALCRYFILQGYEKEKITVLTAYVGQLTQLKKEMPTDFFCGVRVCAVDNFQGEENDIILLSLVRSNEEGKIGFLQIENRVCVALSRAKKGFFCIGNFSLLAKMSPLWNKIISDMRHAGNVGNSLTLTCQNHPQNVIHASVADDFKKAPEGGCLVPCTARLQCGHVCDLMCHPIDPGHEEYECKKPCTKTLCDLHHKCPKKCYEDCGLCLKPLEKVLPCGHLQKVPCFHSNNLSQLKCKIPCLATLNCGHPCTGNCNDCMRGRVHEPCKNNCRRTPFCGHSCLGMCTKNCLPCREMCGNYCKHRKCEKKCGDPCDPCNEKCIWQCQHHKCTKLCSELCDRPRCNEPCTKPLPSCNHPCIGLCGEPCPKKCRECHEDEVTEILFGAKEKKDVRFVELEDCGHVFEVEMMDQWMDQADTSQAGNSVKVQLKCCPKCNVPIRCSSRYGNVVKMILADFKRIKQTILASEVQGSQEVDSLLFAVQQIEHFPSDRGSIKAWLGQEIHSAEDLDVMRNQINLLSFLQMLRATMHRQFEEEEVLRETKKDFERKADELRVRIMALNSQTFSCQRVEEFKEEMHRTQLLVEFRLLTTQLAIRGIHLSITDTVEVGLIREALNSEKKIDKTFRDRCTARIQRIRQEQNIQVCDQAGVSDNQSHSGNSKCLAQACWLKCTKGHIYYVTECGKGIEENKCPDCG